MITNRDKESIGAPFPPIILSVKYNFRIVLKPVAYAMIYLLSLGCFVLIDGIIPVVWYIEILIVVFFHILIYLGLCIC